MRAALAAVLALAMAALTAAPALAGPLTRADIAAQKVGSDTVALAGYRTPGDLGAGAIYTSVGATPTGLEAVKDAGGTWFNLVVTDRVNVGWFGAYGDSGVRKVSAADIAANPAWRGRYEPGVTWDTVAVSEALIAAFGGASTPGHVVWNSVEGKDRLNRTLFVPNARYGINRTLSLAAAFVDIDFATRGAAWVWEGPADQPMLVTDSLAYAYIKNISLDGTNPAAPGQAAPLWVMDHTGANRGLATQQITIVNATIGVRQNGGGISISPSGGGAQGDTITFVNPLFEGVYPDYCLRLGGQNALSIMILDGDFQGCSHDAIQVAWGTVYVYGTSFQDQRASMDVAPVINQLTTFGADLHVYAGEGPTGVNKLEDVRAEDEAPVLCEPGAWCDVEDVESAGGSLQNWYKTYPYVLGQSVNPGDGRTFMVVDDGGVAGWRPLGPATTACVVDDPGGHLPPGALAGKRVFVRQETSGTEHHVIASNTATSITLQANDCMRAPPKTFRLYHVGGITGAAPPDWGGARPGGSTQAWGAASKQGFTTTAGSDDVQVDPQTYGRIAVGDYVMIPNADRLGAVVVLPAALIARVEARADGDRLKLSRPAGASLAYAPGYWGAPLKDGDLSYIDLDFNAFTGAQSVLNSSAAAGRTLHLGTVINYASPRPDWRREGEPAPQGGVYNQLAGPVSRPLARRLAYAAVIDLAASLDTSGDLVLKPAGDALLNAPPPPSGSARELTLQIESAGGAPATIAFGANFRSAGPLVVAAPPGAAYVVRFISDGAAWNEASRSGPLTASTRPSPLAGEGGGRSPPDEGSRRSR